MEAERRCPRYLSRVAFDPSRWQLLVRVAEGVRAFAGLNCPRCGHHFLAPARLPAPPSPLAREHDG